MNSRPLEEQLELLTTEPSLQSPLFFFFFFFSLYSTGCPETHFVDQAGRDPLFILKGFILPCEKEDSYYLGFFFFFFFGDRVSLYSPGCPGTHSVAQAGLELRNPPTSAS